MSRALMGRGVAVGVCALALASYARAQSPQPELKLPRAQFAMGEAIPLELVVQAPAGQDIGQVEIAGIHEFQVHSGPDVAMSMQIDMRTRVSNAVHSYRWQIAPRKPGSFMLGPATLSVGGRPLRSNAVAVKVTAEPQGGGVAASDSQLFIVAQADKPRAYAGQQVVVTYALYSRIQYYQLELRREPTTDGFWVEELEVPRGFNAYRQEVISGVAYRVQTLKQQAVFPLRTGTLTIGPMVLDAQVGAGFLGRGQKYSRASQPLAIEVMPLPTQGQPAGFAAPNVGRYNLSGGVDRQQVQMGEAIKYRVHLEGQGNVKNLVLPELPQGNGYRRFDPEPKVTTRVENGRVMGTRVLEYLLSPSQPGRFTIPPVVFNYFDPEAGAYRVATIPAVAVSVIGGPDSTPVAAAGAATGLTLTPGADPDLRTVHGEIASPPGSGFHRSVAFWALLFAPPVLLAGLVLFGRAWALRGEMRKRNAPKRRAAGAMKRLREAERLLEEDRADGFFAELSQVMSTVLEVKLNQPIGSLTLPELERTLLGRGFDAQTAAMIGRELENCDFGRFAPASSRGEEMRNALARMRALLEAIERVKATTLEAGR